MLQWKESNVLSFVILNMHVRLCLSRCIWLHPLSVMHVQAVWCLMDCFHVWFPTNIGVSDGLWVRRVFNDACIASTTGGLIWPQNKFRLCFCSVSTENVCLRHKELKQSLWLWLLYLDKKEAIVKKLMSLYLQAWRHVLSFTLVWTSDQKNSLWLKTDLLASDFRTGGLLAWQL